MTRCELCTAEVDYRDVRPDQAALQDGERCDRCGITVEEERERLEVDETDTPEPADERIAVNPGPDVVSIDEMECPHCNAVGYLEVSRDPDDRQEDTRLVRCERCDHTMKAVKADPGELFE